MLRRVKKEGSKVSQFIKSDALNECLDCWVRWMHSDADRDLGVRTMRGLVGVGDGHGVDSGEAQQARDNQIAEATDAMIDSLSRVHAWAIYKSCSMATPWNFPNANLPLVAEDARCELIKKLEKNPCTGVLF